MISSCNRFTTHFVYNKVFRLVVSYFPRIRFYSRVDVIKKCKYFTCIFHNLFPITISFQCFSFLFYMLENVMENQIRSIS